jgi:hypothetical protein
MDEKKIKQIRDDCKRLGVDVIIGVDDKDADWRQKLREKK